MFSDDEVSDDNTIYSPTDSVMSHRQQTAVLDTSSTTPVMSHWLGNPLPSSSLIASSSTSLSSTETTLLFANTVEEMTAPSQQGSTSDQEISNTLTISQNILKVPVKVLYLFQCFQEAQDDKLCDILSKSFDSGKIDLHHHRLLSHQVVSLGFFLSRSHRKWKELNLFMCNIRDHGIKLLYHYICGDITNKQEATTINLMGNFLSGASSPLIGDIITHLQSHTLKLGHNNITNVRDISTAVINTNTVKVLYMMSNDLTSQEASAISDMMTCLEELYISRNKLGDDGAVIISKGITKSNTLRVLNISDNNITSTGAIAIANSLHNTSLEELDMSQNAIGQDGATAIAQAITNNKTLKQLNISICEITAIGATAIANSLLHNTSLEELHMSCNAIGEDGATAIAQAITNNKTLKQLNISKCEITATGATAIANSLLHNTSLEVLYMSNNAIGEDGATAIAQAITNNKTLKNCYCGVMIQ
ncbi:leucine-rich repeat-containing protein 74B-like [Dysidea avara]|uniref:leucine-rich repeat-containing protein 74B-like n=1 Tax=Dysidea avara TaxID=196820 RepID=UPI00333262D5